MSVRLFGKKVAAPRRSRSASLSERYIARCALAHFVSQNVNDMTQKLTRDIITSSRKTIDEKEDLYATR